eukprot:TRINITY_DN9172_c0_g1_i2.p1 TRINITY_DN9172_c0_g1~~TRINITY_DN9172_c0_g1_i2.p1  ORF type:complete len:270 (+),score=43.45 TRINITY_DN9172_c0_g1_i2:90-899(+)
MPTVQPRPPPEPPLRRVHRRRAVSPEQRSTAYEFINLTTDERQEQRDRQLRDHSAAALGAGRRERERIDAARQLGNWQLKAEANAAGMTEWELRKHRSRQALTASGIASAKQQVTELELPLLRKASEYGLAGQSYIALTPDVQRKISDRQSPRAAAPPQQHLGDRLAAAAPTQLSTAEVGPDQTSVPTHPSVPYSCSFGPRITSMIAGPTPMTTASPPAGLPVDFDLGRLGYHELIKVKAGLDALAATFPESEYLRPMVDQLARYGAMV